MLLHQQAAAVSDAVKRALWVCCCQSYCCCCCPSAMVFHVTDKITHGERLQVIGPTALPCITGVRIQSSLCIESHALVKDHVDRQRCAMSAICRLPAICMLLALLVV
jgi:hypothetical protein